MIYPCCAKPENLVVKEARGDWTVRVCAQCGRRHIELRVDPGVLGVTGSAT